MHLANGEQTLRYGGAAQDKTAVKVNDNGTIALSGSGAYTNEHVQTSGQSTESNEVELTSLKGQPLDEALNTILAAWTILIQRYQREVFHQFSWGVKGAGSDGRQCIQTTDLDLLNHKNATTLASKIRDLRLKDASLNEATIFLNDGTKEEVRAAKTVLRSVANTS